MSVHLKLTEEEFERGLSSEPLVLSNRKLARAVVAGEIGSRAAELKGTDERRVARLAGIAKRLALGLQISDEDRVASGSDIDIVRERLTGVAMETR